MRACASLLASSLLIALHPSTAQISGNCSTSPCANNGTCVEQAEGGFRCTCQSGWIGQLCDYDYDECEAMPCRNDGACSTPNVGTFLCTCPDGYNGTYCEIETPQTICGIDFNNWEGGYGGDGGASTCMYGESCTWEAPGVDAPGLDAFNCTDNCILPDGYVCSENDYDDCSSSPCQNGGSCMDYRGAYDCMCADNWVGDDCEQFIDPCSLHPCENGGSCNDGICECPEGFSGDVCGVISSHDSLQTTIPVPADLPLYFPAGTCVDLCVGDLDGDNMINVRDLLLMFNFYGVRYPAIECQCPSYCRADLDQNLVADVRDLLGVLSRFGTSC